MLVPEPDDESRGLPVAPLDIRTPYGIGGAPIREAPMTDGQSPLRVFSFGGGIQSTAALVLAATGVITCRVFLFANVGDDSEHPDTLRYVRDVALPYARHHGIEIYELHRTMRNNQRRTLYQEITSDVLASIPIPVRNADGAPGRRSCTKHYKIDVVAAWLKQHGATATQAADVFLGISIDEYQRVSWSSSIPWQRNKYPLIDLRLSRDDCRDIITQAGLPVPIKSSCWFCPFKRRIDWERMQSDQPDLFMNAVILEQDILAKCRKNGGDPHYLSRYGRPLYEVIGNQSSLDLDDMCESGYCGV